MVRFIAYFNAPALLAEHLVGEDHSTRHRMFIGVLVMVFGVTLAKGGADIHLLGIHYLADGIGYAIHGAGLMPFLDFLVARFRSGSGSAAVAEVKEAFKDSNY